MFKKTLKKSLSVATATALTLSAFGFMGNVHAGTTTVKFWHGWTGAEATTLKTAIAKFEKANKGIKVEAVAIPFTQLQNKLQVALMGSSSPTDVFVGPHDWEGVFGTMKGGVLEDLSKTSLKSALKDMKASAVKAGKFKGKQIGFPEFVECPVLVYNKTMVKTPPKTIEQLIKMAKPLTKGGKYGLVMDKGNYYYQRGWYSAFGGTEFTNEENATTGFGSKSFTNFLTFMRDLENQKIMPKNCDYNTAIALFNAGKAAFAIAGPWSFGEIDKSSVKGKWGIANYPSVKGKASHPFMGVKMFYIPKAAKNKEAAAKFVKFMTSSEIEKLFNAKAGDVPANKSAKVSDWKSTAVMDQAEVADAMPSLAEMSQVWTPVIDATNKAMGTKESISKIANEQYVKIKTAISKMRGE